MKPKDALIILAAGYSSRMKRLKALLPIGGITALERLILAGELAGCSEIIVVTGFEAESIKAVTGSAKAIYNPDYAQGMFSSIQKGVAAVSDASDGFFILPVDYPLVTAKLLEELMLAHQQSPEAFFVPTFMGKKGHPPLFPITMKTAILNSQEAGGLKGVTVKHEKAMKKIETSFEGAVMDMDQPDDYQEILLTYQKKQRPSRETCLQVLKEMNTPKAVIDHSLAVSEMAYKISQALNDCGYKFDAELLQAAGLLHDIARTEKKHWLVGAKILRKFGWDDLAILTENHMFYTSQKPVADFSELDILCLADKLFKGSERIDLSLRKENLLERFTDTEAIAAINKRFEKAAELKAFIESQIKRSLDDLLNQKTVAKELKPPKKLWLVRHGQPEQHREKIFLGQTDVDLSEKGIASARITGQTFLQKQLRPKKIYCSDLLRTKHSAEIIIEVLGKPIALIPMPAFREMSLGKWDGCYIEDIKNKYPLAYQQRGEHRLTYKIARGENYYDLSYRVIKGLFKLIDSEEELVIITHAGVIAVIKSFLEKRPLSDTILEKPAYGDIVVVETNTPLKWPGI